MRIAYLTYRGKPHVGGQGVYTRHLTKALVDLGHHVEVYGGQPYPVLDDRIELHRLPSLDIWNDHYRSAARLLGDQDQGRSGRGAHPSARHVRRATASTRVLGELQRRTRDFDLVHDNQCLGYSMVKVEQLIPTVVTLHHPITRDRALEMEHAKTARKRRQLKRWYRFVEMQGKVARQMPRIVVVSENSIKDINADMVSRDQMRLVPVGVDPDLFNRDRGRREPGRLI
ncbi:MAG: glycosyltransferase [Ilumatobacteraceae bacterium]